MTTERDELEGPPYLVGVTDDFPGGNDDDLTEWAFERGIEYQKFHSKPRQVTTVEELDALPIGSVLILRDAKHQPHPAQKGDYGWRLPFLDDFWDSAKILAGCESAEVVAQ